MEIKAEELISAEAKRLSDKYNKDYLDCDDLVKITGIGKTNARILMNRYDFPTTTIGRRKVISVLAFAKWAYLQNNGGKK
jgi:endonuclease III